MNAQLISTILSEVLNESEESISVDTFNEIVNRLAAPSTVVNYFDVQRVAHHFKIDYNSLCAAINELQKHGVD